MSKNSQPARLQRERLTIKVMISMYCRAQNHSVGDLCVDCSQLLDYAIQRIDRCPYQVDKPACANCPTHCYQPEMREQVRRVMRFAGPRMLFRHPYLAFMHLIDGISPSAGEKK